MPPAEMLVEPVHTATGVSLRIRMMNLLCSDSRTRLLWRAELSDTGLFDHGLIVVLIRLRLVADVDIRTCGPGIRPRRG